MFFFLDFRHLDFFLVIFFIKKEFKAAKAGVSGMGKFGQYQTLFL